MRSQHNIITNSPVEVNVPDYSTLRQSVAPEASDALAGLEQFVRNLQSPEITPDEVIAASLQECTKKYISWFADDLNGSLNYLGYNDASTKILEEGETNPSATAGEQKQNGAFGLFRRAFDGECAACGLEDQDKDEAEKLFYDFYHGYVDEKASELIDSLDHFESLANRFGTPDVLRAEAVSAGIRAMDQLRSDIISLGERPVKPSIFTRLGAYASGEVSFSQRQFDETVNKKVSKLRVAEISELLDPFVCQAMLYYAKLSFGAVPYVANRGFKSDPSELFDTYQARQEGDVEITRPILPSEHVNNGLSAKISEMLYSESSPLHPVFERSRDEFKRQGRSHRQSSYFHDRWSWAGDYARSTYNGKDSFAREGSDSKSKPKMKPPKTKTEADVSFDDPRLGELYREFSRLKYGVKIGSDWTKGLQEVEDDFVVRLNELPANTVDMPSLAKLLRTALKDNHPDVNPDLEAEERYKIYSALRDALPKQ